MTTPDGGRTRPLRKRQAIRHLDDQFQALLVVVGEEGSSDGLAGVVVVPDRGGQGEHALQDTDQDTVAGVAAVLFKVELPFEGVEDRLDGLAERFEEATVRAPVDLRALAGDFELTCYWRVLNAPLPGKPGRPPQREAVLWDTSMGLNVEAHPFPADPSSASDSLVRYDYSLDGHGHHLNVYQPPPIRDHAHWRIPTDIDKPWDIERVFDHLMSPDTAKDLNDAGWPGL